MDEGSKYDARRWARIYTDFERDFVDLPRRLFIEIAQLHSSTPIRRVLEIGCGEGKGLEYLRSRLAEAELVGIDPDPTMAKLAQVRLKRRAHISVGSAEDLPEQLGRFDLILSYMNFRLWADAVRGLKCVQAALAVDGMAYLVDIRRDVSPSVRADGLNAIPSEIRADTAAQIESGLTPAELRDRVEAAGISSYRLLTSMPSGSVRGGSSGIRSGSRSTPLAEIMRRLPRIDSARSLAKMQMHLFIYSN